MFSVHGPKQGCCQTKPNTSQSTTIIQAYESADLEPLRESGTAFLFVSLPGLKMSFVIEVIVYLTVITDKPLESCCCFK